MTDMSTPNDELLVAEFVLSKINALRVNGNDANTRATLAKLRRSIGKEPGSDPNVWEETLENLPELMFAQKGEMAIHIALTMFAMHQQGTDIKSDCMHRENETLGTAIKELAKRKGEGGADSIKRRFYIMVTSESIEEFAHHLRSMIQLLKTESIPLDYKNLTRELYRFQNPNNRDRLRLRWGQDFYRSSAKTE